jgi:hypothetical protein
MTAILKALRDNELQGNIKVILSDKIAYATLSDWAYKWAYKYQRTFLDVEPAAWE